MQKIHLSLGTLAFTTLFLSGCTISPPQVGNNTNPGDSAFNTKALPGSIWRSTDGGVNFEPKVTVDEKRKITKADILDISFLLRDNGQSQLGMELRRTPDVFIGTIEDMIFKTADGAETWEPVNFPPEKVYSFIASRRSLDRMYATGVVAGRGKIFRTVDGGTTWQDVYSEPGASTVLVSLAEHPQDVNVLYAGTSAGTVVKSYDGGDTWRNIGAAVDGPITMIAFDATDKNTMYLLSQNSRMYISRNMGETWSDWDAILRDEAIRNSTAQTYSGTAPSGIVSIIADPTLSGTVYAGTSAGLYRSRDFGKNWEKLNIIESAEKFPLRAFAVNPKNSNELIFAAGRTIYKSINSGDTWAVHLVNVDREISTIVYDPVYPEVIYIGLRNIKK